MKQARKIIRLLSASTFIIPKDRQFLSVLDKVLQTAEKHQQSFQTVSLTPISQIPLLELAGKLMFIMVV